MSAPILSAAARACGSGLDGGARGDGECGATTSDTTTDTVGARAPEPAATMPLTKEATAAVLRAIDEEERADALYAQIVATYGSRLSGAPISRAEHRHAWVVTSLALAHGVDVRPNPYASAKGPAFANVALACNAGADGEKRTIATYDDLLKIDLPSDLRHAFKSLRAEAVERHLPAYQACR